jgi:hypothetical protein
MGLTDFKYGFSTCFCHKHIFFSKIKGVPLGFETKLELFQNPYKLCTTVKRPFEA